LLALVQTRFATGVHELYQLLLTFAVVLIPGGTYTGMCTVNGLFVLVADGGCVDADVVAVVVAEVFLQRELGEKEGDFVGPVALEIVKSRFRWVKGFTAEPEGGAYMIFMLGSKIPLLPYRPGREGLPPDETPRGELGAYEGAPERPHHTISAEEAYTEYAHNVGVEHGRAMAAQHGLQDAGWVNPFEFHGKYGQGFDEILQTANGNLVIVEYKGGVEAALEGNQMSREWVLSRIERLRTKGGPLGEMWANKLEASLSQGKLYGVAYKTPILNDVPQATTTIGLWHY